MDKENCYKIAQIVRTHGIEGGIIFKFSNSFPEEFIEEELVFVDVDDILVPFFIESYKVRNTETAIVKLEDINMDSEAKDILYKDIYVLKEAVDTDEDDVSLLRLIGLTAIDSSQEIIGTIKGILEIPNNDQFEIDKNGKELLIPVNDDWIIDIDFDKKQIELDLPDGLLEL